jgi:hypothetical protein
MQLRSYQSGDEFAQAYVYNTAAGSLPGFKPGKPEEIARRVRAGDSDPHAMFYATRNGEVVGYAVFSSSGRVSVPWCLPGAEVVQEPLLETIVAEMKRRGLREAWAAYRADWSPALDFLREHGFTQNRSMINYVAELSRLPAIDQLPSNRLVTHLNRDDLPHLAALAPALFCDLDLHTLEQFYWENPFYSFPDRLLALKDAASGDLRGVSVLVIDDRFADPTKIDSSMPCFRLGAFGTERQRHKRVNGLFSAVFEDERDGDLLLAAAVSVGSSSSALTHLATQAPSDAPNLCAWYDRFFERQASFPILSRRA